MKNVTKKFVSMARVTTFAALAAAFLALAALAAPLAHAGYFNLGTLDIQPVFRDGAQNKDWFVEYLQPGEKLQEQLRISNFSAQPKDLVIYSTDTAASVDTAPVATDTAPIATDTASTNRGNPASTAFFAKTPEEKSDDIAQWINLPTEKLHLGAGESATLSVNFVMPKNAGVGLHTGAIIVREILPADAAQFGNTPAQSGTATNSAPQQLALEKGIRVYLNVTGPVITESQNTGATFSESANALNFKVQTQNTGTTDTLTNFSLEIKNIWGETMTSSAETTRVKPGTMASTEATITKPSFGIYQIYAKSNNNSSLITTAFFLPLWAVLLAAALCLLAGHLRTAQLRTRAAKPSLQPAFTPLRAIFAYVRALPSLLHAANRLTFQRSVAYFTIFALIAVATFSTASFDPAAKAQNLPPRLASSYELTVKWGDFRDIPLSRFYKKNWNGQISLVNGQLSLQQLMHFEKKDNAEVTGGGGNALRFNLTTGPDNDGLILNITPTSTEVPILIYENFDTGERNEFKITDFIDAPGIFPNTLFATYFSVKPGPESALPVEELEATPEIEATPAPIAVIPELENLFIEDLPATPEVLADFILKSDYVEEIVTDRKTSQVATDSILIKALEATPEILSEITATPDLNFIFVPTEKVNFPPQEFSFDEEKFSASNLGTLIFVQNKGTPWNTYVTTSEFTSLSGKGIIPASSLTLVPGEPLVLNEKNGARIQTGNVRTFSGPQDRSVLVNVDPGSATEQIFVMNPQLQIRVPPGTLPGRYRGTLTITSL